MLFDLKGKRRRAVQGTYLTLAILLGAGLVLFGVGSSTSGGLGDIFKGGGSGTGHAYGQQQVDAANRTLRLRPQDPAALKQLVVGHYRLATADSDPNTGLFGKRGKLELAQAAGAWQRYLALGQKADATLANYMLQGYSEIGLNQPAKATQAAEIIAEAQPSAEAYVRIVQYAALAHDTRTVDLATGKALALTPAAQRATVNQQIAQAKGAAATQAGQATGAKP
ncbi:MAG: hypothetical protein NVSMB25_00560 [Thermoleophilaceae bacterium]